MKHAIGNSGSGLARRMLGAAAVVGALSMTAHADVWSVVNLHPAGATDSYAFGVHGSQQVGYATVGGVWRASLWSDTAASWVDLTPADSNWSNIYNTHGDQQVGTALRGGVYRASMWTGSVASWVDLNPSGATLSEARGVYGGQQVGYAVVGGVDHAGLWTGSAASWVDLNPAGTTTSVAYGVYGGQQVGYATVGGLQHASLWTGSAASWVDLHALLPSQFTSSYARGVWDDGVFTYVAGYGYNATAGRDEALMWVSPEPASGLVVAAGLTAFALFRRRRK